ncbi:MAG: phosphoribosyltransferase family protein [Dehalococcoidales bacterium]|nr:phosphoribosyltransferase family protein [Dehalococcoidales bacterium]
MNSSTFQSFFENRYDAGRMLAKKLMEYAGKPVVVLGIPNGGVAVALQVALALNAELDVVISRKIPLPMRPEGGFGSITDDGTIILDEELIKKNGITEEQIKQQVNKVKASIRQRAVLYYQDRPPLDVDGKIVIIVDDGLASGYTMRAAIESIKKHHPAQIIAAVPVAPAHAVKDVQKAADKVVACVVSNQSVFFVADSYTHWYDITDSEVLSCLKEWQIRRNGDNIQVPERKRRSA